MKIKIKICRTCGIEKNIDDFYSNRFGNPQAHCKECLCVKYRNQRDEKRKNKRMEEIKELKIRIAEIKNDIERGNKLIELYKLRYDIDELHYIFDFPKVDIETFLSSVGIFGIKYKRCSICKIRKSLDEFHNNINLPEGKDYRCKSCKKQHDEKPEIRARRREFTKKWDQENREYKNQYMNNRYHENIKVKISVCFSSIMYYSLKKCKYQKEDQHWETLIDYTLEQLMLHLETQFDDKMTWDNYGSYWQIDHIVPISAFNFTSYEDEAFKRCWSLQNLRPLHHLENKKKNNLISEEFGNIELAAQLL